MHQYLDSDGSGTSTTCVSSTIGSERLKAATEWLRANGKKGLLGEYAGAVNPTCQAAVKDMLSYMVKNKDVWQGAVWWAAGPWWGEYVNLLGLTFWSLGVMVADLNVATCSRLSLLTVQRIIHTYLLSLNTLRRRLEQLLRYDAGLHGQAAIDEDTNVKSEIVVCHDLRICMTFIRLFQRINLVLLH